MNLQPRQRFGCWRCVLIISAINGIFHNDQAEAVTLQDVSLHNSENDCWSVVDGTVYDITAYIPSHPRKGGGSSVVAQMCGHDGTALYDTAHSNEHHYLSSFSSIQTIGELSDAVPDPTPEPTLVPITTKPTVPPTPEPTAEPTTTKPTVHPTVPSTTVKPTSPPTLATTPPPTSPPTLAITSPPSSPPTLATTSPPTSPPTLATTSPPTSPPTLATTSPPTLSPTNEPTSSESSPLPTLSPVEDGDGDVGGESGGVGETHNVSSACVNCVELEELRLHATPADCWVSYFGEVYNVTDFAPNHPVAGPEIIYQNCGDDGTAAYSVFHDKSLLSIIQQHFIGPLVTNDDDNVTIASVSETTSNSNNAVSTLRAILPQEVATHDQPSDCWTIYYGNVYDLTLYSHPGEPPEYGQRVIYLSCGRDGTVEYASVHPKDLLKTVKQFKVGWISSGAVSAFLSGFIEISVIVTAYYINT